MVLSRFSLGSNTAFNPSTIVPTYGASGVNPSTIRWSYPSTICRSYGAGPSTICRSYGAGGAPIAGSTLGSDRRGPDSGTLQRRINLHHDSGGQGRFAPTGGVNPS